MRRETSDENISWKIHGKYERRVLTTVKCKVPLPRGPNLPEDIRSDICADDVRFYTAMLKM
jgi:hypothetical protein